MSPVRPGVLRLRVTSEAEIKGSGGCLFGTLAPGWGRTVAALSRQAVPGSGLGERKRARA